ncbi:MAG: YceI family protein [Crocinitomicaceae bacterium]|nr:YceI family protein [Crocinitomicaceae bacterium]
MESLVKTKWAIDPTHSEIGFKVKHMMISTVKGHFDNFEATLESESEDFEGADIQVSIDANSVNTKNTDRDGHLKSEDFFNAEEFPKITFRSTSFDGETLKGELSIRDITKAVELDVDYNGTAVDPYGNTKAGFEISGEINRKDFGLSWNAVTEAGNIVVSDKVKLIIDAQFVREE